VKEKGVYLLLHCQIQKGKETPPTLLYSSPQGRSCKARRTKCGAQKALELPNGEKNYQYMNDNSPYTHILKIKIFNDISTYNIILPEQIL